MLYTDTPHQIRNKKRFASSTTCKPLFTLVGAIGVEPTTSTVSG